MRRPTSLALTILVALAALSLSSTAFAQDKLAVMKLDSAPGGEDAAYMVTEALKAAVRKSDYQLSAKGGDISLSDAQLVAECEDTTLECLDTVAAFLESDHIVFGLVDAEGNTKITWFKKGKGIEGESDGLVTSEEEAATLARRLFSGAVGTLIVTSGEEIGAEVLVDGSPVGITPFEAELTVGSHTVQVRKQGFGDVAIRSVDVRDAQTSSEDFPLVALPDRAIGGSVPPMAKVGFYVGGAGALVAIGGVVTGVMTQSLEDDLKQDTDACTSGQKPELCTTLKGTSDDGQTMALVTNVLFGVGGAALATGVALIVYGYSAGGGEDTEVSNVDFNFALAPDGAAGMFTWRF